ncbi:MAG: hypothetical protein IJB07_00470, partial [Firmicutes bacterium]|nr:hypothetical protein [Bacillota bacterium]
MRPETILAKADALHAKIGGFAEDDLRLSLSYADDKEKNRQKNQNNSRTPANQKATHPYTSP